MRIELNDYDVEICDTLETFSYSLGATLDVPREFITEPVSYALITKLRWSLPCSIGVFRGSVGGFGGGVYLVYCCGGKIFVYQLRKDEKK